MERQEQGQQIQNRWRTKLDILEAALEAAERCTCASCRYVLGDETSVVTRTMRVLSYMTGLAALPSGLPFISGWLGQTLWQSERWARVQRWIVTGSPLSVAGMTPATDARQ